MLLYGQQWRNPMDKITITPNIRGGNQASMTFTILNSVDWNREMLLDPSNSTYECTRLRADLVLAYNPGAASFKANLVPNAVPNAAVGQMPVTTDVALRRFLEQPRFQFEVESSGHVWLTSPPDGPNGPLLADVRNGPFMKVNSIAKIAGERFWQIHIQIETYINEFPRVSGTSYPPLIISNRWHVIEGVDFNHLRTRTYQGICTVRSDVLQAQGSLNNEPYIDFFRSQFAGFKCPIGHQRTHVKVAATPDGNSAHYTVVDTEQMFDKGTGCPAVRLEFNDTNHMRLTPGTKLLIQGLGAEWRALDAVSGNNRAPAMIREAAARLAKAYKTVLVRAWGNKITQRHLLMQYALAVAYARMGIVTSVFDPTLSELTVQGDTNNFVQVTYTLSWGSDVGNLFDAFTATGNLLAQATGFASPPQAAQFEKSISEPATTRTNNPNTTISQTPGRNPPFPDSSETRGTYGVYANQGQALKYLITQALEQFDGTPASPTVFDA